MYISAPNDLVMESLGSVTLVSGTTPTFDFNNTNGTNGTFLSISQDVNSNVDITTASAPLPSSITPNPNPTPNLSITALGSMYLISDSGTVYIENNLTVGSTGGGTITAGEISGSSLSISGTTATIDGSAIVTQNTLGTTLSSFGGSISTTGEIQGGSLNITGTGTIDNVNISTLNSQVGTLDASVNTLDDYVSNLDLNVNRLGTLLSSSYQNYNTSISTFYAIGGGTSFNVPADGIYLLFANWSTLSQGGNTNVWPGAWLLSYFSANNGNNGFEYVFGNKNTVTVSMTGNTISISGGDGSGIACLYYIGGNYN
jgi:hypothetical protein